MLLEVKGLQVRYGGIRAVKGVDLEVREGELVCLIGANGAGKTSTLKAICRLLPSQASFARYAGADLDGLRVHELPRRGLVMVPEGRGVFPQLTVQENLAMGAYARGGASPDAQYASFPRLKERRHQVAGTLSGGEQQMLALARALMSRPRLLLLDEPSLGLAPMIVREFFRIVRELNEKEGLTVLVVEQDARIALRSSARAYVLEVGRVALTGTSEKLQGDESVRRSYLGY
jgi:branched-chain amino acid transport system ATP-binding protein